MSTTTTQPLPSIVSAKAVASCRDHLPDPAVLFDAADVFRALGNPVRLGLVHALTHQEMSVGDLARVMGLSLSVTSHQLALLRHLKIVSSRDVGRVTFYRAIDRCVGRLVHDCLGHVSEKLGIETPPDRRKASGAQRRGRPSRRPTVAH